VRVGDRVLCTYAEGGERPGRVVAFEEHEHYNPATRKTTRRAWVVVRIDGGKTHTFPPSQVRPMRER
jgi:hypothetical protein